MRSIKWFFVHQKKKKKKNINWTSPTVNCLNVDDQPDPPMKKALYGFTFKSNIIECKWHAPPSDD